MNVDINNSWMPYLQQEFEKPYFENLMGFVTDEYHQHVCYPPKENIFSAFEYCDFDNLKVVIIGQDPYHGVGQANGLSFSVSDGIKSPPSLINIFKEIEADLAIPFPTSGNLERWAKQGVLLLNATLTVRANEAGSHQKRGWETFTDAIINIISEEKENVIFLLWGGFAKKKAKLINTRKHIIMSSGHPSPLSANRGHWFGNKHFSQTNHILREHHQKDIEW